MIALVSLLSGFNPLSTTRGYYGLSFDLTLKGQVRGQAVIPEGHTIVLKGRISELKGLKTTQIL